jgi:hypothetical protein
MGLAAINALDLTNWQIVASEFFPILYYHELTSIISTGLFSVTICQALFNATTMRMPCMNPQELGHAMHSSGQGIGQNLD